MRSPPRGSAARGKKPMTGALASRFTTNLGIGLILAAILVPLVGRYAYAGLLAVAGVVCIIAGDRMIGRLR